MKKILFPVLMLMFVLNVNAQDEKTKPQFEMKYNVETTPVKSQYRTGTCWAFATTSFWETELLRIGKDPIDLSEMYTVRMTYPVKAEKYIRYHGTFNFGEGGQAHDVMHTLKNYGMVPQSVYNGNVDDPKTYNHRELRMALKGALDGILKSGSKISLNYPKVVESILNIYLGEPPAEFEYNGETYTPKSFMEKSGLNPDDYIELTSYNHHPFYEKFILELPDNWTDDYYYNVPMNDLIEIMDNAIENGYSVAWDGDVSRDNFYRDKGYALVPVKDADTDDFPVEELDVTQQMRQDAFDSFDVTDDHLMHVTGIAQDQFGKKYYYTKNSWGTENKGFDGYWYMSESYVKLKTIAITVHKDAIPAELKSKLCIK